MRDFFEFCFPAGTPIKTLEGQKNIEDISIGDVVIANDDNNHICALGDVENVYARDVNTLLTLKTEDGHDLNSSLNHPYFIVETNSYKRADEIQIGEHVLSVDGRQLRVTEIEKKEFDSPKKVYNLNVKEYHTYYAGDSSLLVHNCGGLVEGVGESVKDTFVSIHEALKTSAEEQNRFLEELIAKKSSGDSGSKDSSQDKGDSQSIEDVYQAIADKVADVIKGFPEYSASEKGELVGELIGEIAGFFNPTTVGAKGAKVGSKIAKILKDPKHGSKVSKAMKEGAEDVRKAAKHSRWAKQYENKPTKEIKKGIHSFEKQIEIHQDKIRNPKAYDSNWDKYSLDRKNYLTDHWKRDIARQKEHKHIAEQILKSKFKDEL